MKFQLQDISDKEFARIHESVLRMLSEIGVLFEDANARELLVKAGNQVDSEGRTHFKPKYVESMLDLVPKDGFMMYGRDESHAVHVAVDQMSFRPSTGMPFILDYASRRRRKVTMDDARMMTTLVDALDGYDIVNSIVNPAGVPGTAKNVLRFVNAHRHSLKPSDLTVMNREEVAAIAEVAAAIRGGEKKLREKPLTVVDVAMITPLRCSSEQAEAMIECARRGVPVEILTSPAMGMTSPITLAGSSALATAEVLAGLCLVYTIAPGLGIVNKSCVSPTDMHTTAYNFGTPEMGMSSVLAGACSARYNIPSNLYGLGTIAKVPGAQASMEKTFSGLLMALGRPYLITGGGLLDNALTTSPEQLVIDNEAIRFIKRICQPIDIDDEAIAVDVLKRSISGDGCFIADSHTLKHLHAGEMLECGLGQWVSYSEWEADGARDLFDRAHVKVEEILNSHRVPPFDRSTETEINKIVSRAESRF